jgi:uncharacterized protein (DUF362 family)
MKRRDFLKASGSGLAAAAASQWLGPPANALAAEAAGTYDLVAVKGATPDKLFDAGISAMGGMNRYVKPGQTVVVKPNIAWDAEPARAANTNPLLVRRGPRGVSTKDVVQTRSQLIATDMVTADAAAARLFGTKPHEIPYIRKAAAQGAGRMDLENLSIKRIAL